MHGAHNVFQLGNLAIKQKLSIRYLFFWFQKYFIKILNFFLNFYVYLDTFYMLILKNKKNIFEYFSSEKHFEK